MIYRSRLLTALVSGLLACGTLPALAEEPSTAADACAGITGIMRAQCERQHTPKEHLRSVCTDAGDEREARRCRWGERKQILEKLTGPAATRVHPVVRRALDKRLAPCDTLGGAEKRACIQKIRQQMVGLHPRSITVLEKRGITKKFEECRDISDRTERFACIHNVQEQH